MNRQEIITLLSDYENQHPVEDYRVFGFWAWPVIRIKLAFSLIREELLDQAALNRSSGLLVSRKARLFGPMSRQVRNLLAFFHSLGLSRHVDPVQKNKDYLFITAGNRCTLIGKKNYHTVVDPIISQIYPDGGTSLIWEVRTSPEDRILAPADLSKWLFFEKIRRKMLPCRLTRDDHEPDWFKEITDLSREMNLSISWDSFGLVLKNLNHTAIIMQEWLEMIHPKAVLIDCWYSPSSMAAILAAGRLGIPTIELQHGLQGTDHFAYSCWKKMNIPKEETLLPSHYWTWGENDKNNLLTTNGTIENEDHVIVGGNSWLNIWKTNPPEVILETVNKAKMLRKNDKKVILVTLQYMINHKDHLLEAVENSPCDWLWLIRLHRQMRERLVEIENDFKSVGGNRVECRQSTSLPLYAVFQAADVHVTWYSTCALEALAFGRPSVILHPSGWSAFSDCIVNQVMFPAENQQELFHAIDACNKVSEDQCLRAAEPYFAGPEKTQSAIECIMNLDNKS